MLASSPDQEKAVKVAQLGPGLLTRGLDDEAMWHSRRWLCSTGLEENRGGPAAAGTPKRQALSTPRAELIVMGKAKPAKHTAAEIKGKIAAATTNKGGGSAGMVDRLGGRAGHAKFQCPVCAQQAPDLKTMEMHHESKHPKLPFDAEKCRNMHDIVGGTTQGVAVRGSTKKK